MYLLIKGIVAGFSIAAPVGAIGFLCIQQTLRGGVFLGLVSGLGAATADTVYGILVALGAHASQVWLLSYKSQLTLLGGLFLCYLGIKKIISKPHSSFSQPIKSEWWKAYVITFFLTLTNPATILDFAALFTGLNIAVSGNFESLMFVAGVFIGSAAWWFTLCSVVWVFRGKISEPVFRYINYVAGLLIFSFGVYALISLR